MATLCFQGIVGPPTAISERLQRPSDSVAVHSASNRLVPLLTAAAGFVAGTLGGWLSTAFSGSADVVFGALLVVGGLALATRTEETAAKGAQVKLAAWWLTVPAGMMFAMNELLTDPVWFAALAWFGTAAFASALPRLLRRLRMPNGPIAEVP